MITGVGPQSSLVVSALGDMRTQLTDLQRQLSTGQRSTTYAGLGIQRGLAVGLRGQLTAMKNYADTVTQIGVRMSVLMRELAWLGKESIGGTPGAGLVRVERRGERDVAVLIAREKPGFPDPL